MLRPVTSGGIGRPKLGSGHESAVCVTVAARRGAMPH
jgi:hypothetical protein